MEIAYFGLLPEFVGRGWGSYLLTSAVREAWAIEADRVWLHTCTLDHPAALPNYLHRGFSPVRTETYSATVGGEHVAHARQGQGPGMASSDILRATAIVAGVFVALQLLWVGRSVVLLGFFGMLLGITLSAGVDRLEKLRVPRGVGAVLIVAVAIAALVGLGFITAPQITKQVGELQQQVPQAIDRAEQWIQQRGGGVAELIQARIPPAPAGKADATSDTRPRGRSEQDHPRVAARVGLEAGNQGATGRSPPEHGQQLSGVTTHFFAVFSSTVAVLGGIILLLFVSIFIAAEPDLYHRGLMHLFPHRRRAKAGEVLSATATTLRRWLVMQFLAMLVIGAVTTVALLLIGVKAAVALGIIAGLLEFIPYVGPILSAVPADRDGAGGRPRQGALRRPRLHRDPAARGRGAPARC